MAKSKIMLKHRKRNEPQKPSLIKKRIKQEIKQQRYMPLQQGIGTAGVA